MQRIIVVIPTFYTDTNDVRYHLALETCRTIATEGLEGIVVDASPSPQIRQALEDAGTIGSKKHVRVVEQISAGRKGTALREGILLADKSLNDDQEEDDQYVVSAFLAFQEPEKVDMVRHWKHLVSVMEEQQADICVPARTDASFRSTYPIEQYHSEQFANLYLNTLAIKTSSKFPDIDWTMGPIILRASMARHWSAYHGDLWDMQLIPMIRAQRWHGAKVLSEPVEYLHPASMKEEEEGVPLWSEKRLMQLNFLFEHVGKALQESAADYHSATEK